MTLFLAYLLAFLPAVIHNFGCEGSGCGRGIPLSSPGIRNIWKWKSKYRYFEHNLSAISYAQWPALGPIRHFGVLICIGGGFGRGTSPLDVRKFWKWKSKWRFFEHIFWHFYQLHSTKKQFHIHLHYALHCQTDWLSTIAHRWREKRRIVKNIEIK